MEFTNPVTSLFPPKPLCLTSAFADKETGCMLDRLSLFNLLHIFESVFVGLNKLLLLSKEPTGFI